MPQSSSQNRLVRCFRPFDFDALRLHLKPVKLKARQILVQRNAHTTFIYFLENGQASVLAKVPASEPIEVGMFGREGMSNMSPADRDRPRQSCRSMAKLTASSGKPSTG
jgi:CRP-like cAMP-binding protein